MHFGLRKKENDGQMIPAEPLEDFHMPNNSILPFIMTLGLFIAAFGALNFAAGKDWALEAVSGLSEKPWAVYVLIAGLAITAVTMIIRSLKDDLGYHVKKEEIERDLEEAERGAK